MTAETTLDLSKTLAVLLAGGQGSRLHELTHGECKPALLFGDRRRIVDFTVAGAVRSGIRQMIVATQYEPATLNSHMVSRWGRAFSMMALRHGPTVTGRPEGYAGTAAVVAANMAEIDASGAEEIVVLAGDHIYDMNLTAMIADHRMTGADVTVAVDAVPLADATAFGVMGTDADGRIRMFVEKPAHPPHMPGDPSRALASMGIYVFKWAWLRAALVKEMAADRAEHDFGKHILPLAVANGHAYAHTRMLDDEGRAPYWRDVGTLDAFRKSWIDLRDGLVRCRLPDTVNAGRRMLDPGHDGWTGYNLRAGGLSLAPPSSMTRRWTLLDDTVVMPGARIEPGARLTRAIVAPGAIIPADLTVGEDAMEDARWFRVSTGGTTLITPEMLSRRASARAPIYSTASLSTERI
ncbi:sugar phosphate nucleotidyltransferase [Falsirhodobacter halotolerans]|uniref:sugar phosphate nucleotidyltransferase n=1 Tax=Falsirhodobacter halotolerans TaxID=1146892 RepID=UPI001FD1D997|nr:sugar phosphate nucleotidyltransferase [Falsirhodobacter halotolerans]MCJ8140481.1 sugar phosphate nucleotidyltransferase [Falsirhodobacter halotolerans]